MTDADFAKIKARFPALRWRKDGPDHAVAYQGAYAAMVLRYRDTDRWTWHLSVGRGTTWRARFLLAGGDSSQTLGRCLRSLECAILREARTLAGMVGGKVVEL